MNYMRVVFSYPDVPPLEIPDSNLLAVLVPREADHPRPLAELVEEAWTNQSALNGWKSWSQLQLRSCFSWTILPGRHRPRACCPVFFVDCLRAERAGKTSAS